VYGVSGIFYVANLPLSVCKRILNIDLKLSQKLAGLLF